MLQNSVRMVVENVVVQNTDLDKGNVTKMMSLVNAGAKTLDLFPPTFVSVGGIARCQLYLGACYGYQLNIGYRGKELYVTKYRLRALLAGKAKVLKTEFYLAACFGNCMEGYESGWFVTADALSTVPVQGIANLGLFGEFGMDVTKLFTPDYRLQENATLYLGGGLDIGAGYGISAGVYYYELLESVPLKQATKEMFDFGV